MKAASNDPSTKGKVRPAICRHLRRIRSLKAGQSPEGRIRPTEKVTIRLQTWQHRSIPVAETANKRSMEVFGSLENRMKASFGQSKQQFVFSNESRSVIVHSYHPVVLSLCKICRKTVYPASGNRNFVVTQRKS